MRASFLAVLLLASATVGVFAHPSAAQSSPSNQPSIAPAQRTYFVKLIPPRSTFLQDMTEAEHKLMEEHFVYWKDQYQKGVCLFGGPVLDPRGVFGVLAIRAASEDEARTIAAADPSVKAGVNRIEVAEMRVAFPPAKP
jgi:uncharacterized protein YciI